jgi:hypothetical protein
MWPAGRMLHTLTHLSDGGSGKQVAGAQLSTTAYYAKSSHKAWQRKKQWYSLQSHILEDPKLKLHNIQRWKS